MPSGSEAFRGRLEILPRRSSGAVSCASGVLVPVCAPLVAGGDPETAPYPRLGELSNGLSRLRSSRTIDRPA